MHWSLDLSLSIDAGGVGIREAQASAFILDGAINTYLMSSQQVLSFGDDLMST